MAVFCANAACTQTAQIAINPKVLPFVGLYPLRNGPVSGNTGSFRSIRKGWARRTM